MQNGINGNRDDRRTLRTGSVKWQQQLGGRRSGSFSGTGFCLRVDLAQDGGGRRGELRAVALAASTLEEGRLRQLVLHVAAVACAPT